MSHHANHGGHEREHEAEIERVLVAQELGVLRGGVDDRRLRVVAAGTLEGARA